MSNSHNVPPLPSLQLTVEVPPPCHRRRVFPCRRVASWRDHREGQTRPDRPAGTEDKTTARQRATAVRRDEMKKSRLISYAQNDDGRLSV